jgi:hypothetical protein
MKKFIIPGMAIIALAFTLAAGFLQTLDITQEDAENAIWYSFSTGSYNGPAKETFHNFTVPVRVAMVKEIGAFAKAYSGTEDFKKKYAQYRENRKPSPPEPLKTLAETRKESRATIQKALVEAEENAKKATGDTKKIYEGVIPVFKQQLKDLDDPNNPMYTPEMEAMVKQGHDDQVKAYQEQVKVWEKKYPTTPTAMVKETLKYFLELSATVDFNAKLKKGPENKMLFVNPEYENKTSDWKYIYRSGKESTDAARAIATQWLGELK